VTFQMVAAGVTQAGEVSGDGIGRQGHASSP
jgi:hypothetical protein